MAESGGNTCSSNGNNFGVLQLTVLIHEREFEAGERSIRH